MPSSLLIIIPIDIFAKRKYNKRSYEIDSIHAIQQAILCPTFILVFFGFIQLLT